MRAPFVVLSSLVSAVALPGCAVFHHTPQISYDKATAAVFQAPAPRPVKVVEVSQPLPLPGQLKPIHASYGRRPERSSPASRVERANDAARVQPSRDGYVNAIQVYPWSDGALFEIYAAPEEVTDIELEPGEVLSGTGPVAAGDTVRWVVGNTESGSGPSRRVHILVKPTRPGLETNLVIDTDRRTYHLELRSTEKTYMASVSWRYPQDELMALKAGAAEAAAVTPVASGINLDQLHFRYKIKGDKVAWRPLRVFDDGQQVFIDFPAGIAQGEMPPLFVVGANGKTGDLVNYRVDGHHMIVDRLFAAAELRMGGKGADRRVRIVRTDAR
ncbi:type IV secretion system protein VirB9 [Tistlia consotensis]|uniref:Type IV secretion system protein VirB9 n=1 Tax=Tistlia consotensis USBA 355 TaxID=560819 RepID=A0A1Y6CZ58_9PROT|nr:P-type conjugative transfer protein TrbG [Tistlia consotensis]SMF84140.1 type IV secretion system protein VirB9 [Tistlia consotensis USBA 355]SNS35825.1 type IV secretion system protein VirB9 [Tistlia consotensis]